MHTTRPPETTERTTGNRQNADVGGPRRRAFAVTKGASERSRVIRNGSFIVPLLCAVSLLASNALAASSGDPDPASAEQTRDGLSGNATADVPKALRERYERLRRQRQSHEDKAALTKKVGFDTYLRRRSELCDRIADRVSVSRVDDVHTRCVERLDQIFQGRLERLAVQAKLRRGPPPASAGTDSIPTVRREIRQMTGLHWAERIDSDRPEYLSQRKFAVIAGRREQIAAVDLMNGEQAWINNRQKPADGVSTVVAGQDGRLVFAQLWRTGPGRNNRTVVLDAETGERISTLEDINHSFAQAGRERYLIVEKGSTLAVHDLIRDRMLFTEARTQGLVQDIRHVDDNRFVVRASASAYGDHFELWRMRFGPNGHPRLTRSSRSPGFGQDNAWHPGTHSWAVAPDGNWVYGVTDETGRLRAWRLPSFEETGRYALPSYDRYKQLISPSRRSIAVPVVNDYDAGPDENAILYVDLEEEAVHETRTQGHTQLAPIPGSQHVIAVEQRYIGVQSIPERGDSSYAAIERLPMGAPGSLRGTKRQDGSHREETRDNTAADRGDTLTTPEDAPIYAVGVYEGHSPPGQSHEPGNHPELPVDIAVRDTERPVVLVLSSYEPVVWRVDAADADVHTVLLSSYHESRVKGLEQVPVIRVGRVHAHERGTSDYSALEQEVESTIGRGIDVFQGKYTGKRFTIGPPTSAAATNHTDGASSQRDADKESVPCAKKIGSSYKWTDDTGTVHYTEEPPECDSDSEADHQ